MPRPRRRRLARRALLPGRDLHALPALFARVDRAGIDGELDRSGSRAARGGARRVLGLPTGPAPSGRFAHGPQRLRAGARAGEPRQIFAGFLGRAASRPAAYPALAAPAPMPPQPRQGIGMAPGRGGAGAALTPPLA
jgi:hypothetical protein